MLKRCWSLIHCELHSRCELPHIDASRGQFQPENVGEFCHHFRALVTPLDDGHIKRYTAGCEVDRD